MKMVLSVALATFALVFALNSADAATAFVDHTKICTFDINAWGNPSLCACPTGYNYNRATGVCFIQPYRKPGSVCTTDLNQWGNPSSCKCSIGYAYEARDRSCVLQENLRPTGGSCTKDFNPWGHASQCDCPKDYLYKPTTGLCSIP